MRIELLNEAIVITYCALIRSGVVMPKPIVWQKKESYAVIAGNHRVESSRRVFGHEAEIECEVFEGDYLEALKLCFEEARKSSTIGLRYYESDYKEQIRRAISEFPYMNQEQISDMIGCSRQWVNRIAVKDNNKGSKPRPAATSATSGFKSLHSKTNATKPTTQTKTSVPPRGKTSSPPKRKEPDLVPDSLGFPVPSSVNDTWNERHEMNSHARAISDVVQLLESQAMARYPHFINENELKMLTDSLEKCAKALRNSAPYCVCPDCLAVTAAMTSCRLCHGVGILTKHVWHAVPENTRNNHESKIRTNSR